MLSKPFHNITKRDKVSPKNRCLVVHIAELSITVVEVAIKVINASLTQNQCFQCVTPHLTHVGIPRPRDANELNNDGMIHVRRRPLPKSNRIYQFFRKRFNQRRLQFLFAYSFCNWLAVSCFYLWKAFVNCPSLSVKGIFDDVRHDVIPT